MQYLLSKDDYTKILQNHYKSSDFTFLSAEFKPISEDVEGFLGEHNHLHITCKLNDVLRTEVFFIKNKPHKNQLQLDISEGIKAYKKEIFFYNYLLKEFEKYGCDTNFAAKCLLTIPEEALILQNLTYEGYVLNGRYKTFNLPHIKCALNALAMFHGAGIVYEQIKSKELQKNYSIIDEFNDVFEETFFIMQTNPSSITMKWWTGSYSTITTLIDLLPRDETFKKKFKSMFENFKFGSIFSAKTDYMKTCGHGDLWSNNMLFKYENLEPIECRLLDFQVCRYFYPSFDVLLVIFGNTSPSFRKEYLQELFKYYYNTLESMIAKHGYKLEDMMSFNDFLQTVRLIQRDAMLQILPALSVSNLPKNLANSIVQDNSSDKLEDFLFDNGKFCAEAYKTDEKYRNMIIEGFDEYYNILLSYE